jgi:choline dehydrogenase-like flavoprotein
MNLNTKAKQANTFDAIVVGSGISGGWAAKELCEKGLKVVMLERGRDIKHIEGYKTATLAPWELEHRGKVTTARMGTSAKNSVLNKYNQVWGAENVYVTDGAFMTSASCVNPSLTYMAMTARAANHAVSELKKQNL